MSAPTAAQRAQVIAGLRELADLLDAHPELPVPCYPRLRVTANDINTDIAEGDDAAARAFVDQVAAVLGIPVITTDHGGHYDTTWLSAGAGKWEGDDRWRLVYEVGHISTAVWEQYYARKSYEPNVQVTA